MACSLWLGRCSSLCVLSRRVTAAPSIHWFSSESDSKSFKMTTRAKSAEQLVEFAKTKKVSEFLMGCVHAG